MNLQQNKSSVEAGMLKEIVEIQERKALFRGEKPKKGEKQSLN